MAETRFTQADLARGLNTNQTAIIRHLAKYTIKTEDLWNLSKTLGVNMLDILAKKHPIQTPSEKEIALQQRVTDLEKEVAIYKDLLRAK
jgi:hypothetical protein